MSTTVSVCIPSYNNSLFIRETIDSILSQSFADFELIIVDDCSTDTTWEEISSYKDKRISAIRNEKNLGMHGNWSKAIHQAKGKYIKLVCGDDILLKDCLKIQVEELEKDRDGKLAMVSCRRNIIKANGKMVFGSFYKLRPGYYKGSEALRYCVMFGTNLIGEPMSVLFRRAIFFENKLELGSNNYLIDLDLYSKLLKYGDIMALSDYLAAFRVHGGSMSGSLGFKHASMFNEFTSGQEFGAQIGLRWHQKLMGKAMNYAITLARNIVMSLS